MVVRPDGSSSHFDAKGKLVKTKPKTKSVQGSGAGSSLARGSDSDKHNKELKQIAAQVMKVDFETLKKTIQNRTSAKQNDLVVKLEQYSIDIFGPKKP